MHQRLLQNAQTSLLQHMAHVADGPFMLGHHMVLQLTGSRHVRCNLCTASQAAALLWGDEAV